MTADISGTSFTIAGLASAGGVNIETVRYYQRRGLIPEPPRPLGGVRHYASTDAERLRFIKRAQAMGFTLGEIRNLLTLRTHASCRMTRELAARKLQLIDARIRELRKLRHELVQVIGDCDANTEDSVCPAIERLASVKPVTRNRAGSKA